MRRRILSLVLCLGFLFQQTGFAQIAAVELNLSSYLARIESSFAIDKFRPVHLRYFSYDNLNNDFKVILDRGDLKQLGAKQLEDSTRNLLNYFLIGITLPNQAFWVNLRPDSEDQIIDRQLALTDVGKIMLETDLQLKKDTARLTSPQTPEGKEYWRRLYKKAEELYGNENISIPTLTRPWIVPGEIIVREAGNSAYVYKANLKVMLESDYLANSTTPAIATDLSYVFKDPRSKNMNEYSTQLIKELIIPKLTKEVNNSKRYAAIRQVYYSLILSRWFKISFQGKGGTYASLINKANLTGLTSKDNWSKTTYFKEYQKSFRDGEYNIKEPVYTPTGQVIRSYFSGGMNLNQGMDTKTNSRLGIFTARSPIGPLNKFTGRAGYTAIEGKAKPELTELSVGSMRMTKQALVASPIQVSGPEDLMPLIKEKGIQSALLALDWNIPVKDGRIETNELVVNSLATIDWAFNDAGLRYLYVMTHSGRPSGTGYEEGFSLGLIVDETRRLLGEEGINNLEIILLPYDLSQAKTIIAAKKAEAGSTDKRILFVFENIRMYPGEQAKDPRQRESFEREIISLTGESVENLVYLVEAFDKAHRAEEASMEMGSLLFPREHIAAGVKVVEESNKVMTFLARVTGKLSAIAGGATFDKMKNFGDLGKRIGKSGGRLFVVGALANPLLARAGVNIGNSLMPTKSDDIKAVQDGQKKLSENTRDNKLQVSLPVDFIVKEARVVKETLEPKDEQIDTGPETTRQIVDYIDSLRPGDGLLMNGGTGVFDQDWGSKTGTIAVVTAANEAAKRGVAVFFAGGDMYNAIKIVQRETGLELDPSVFISTAGGALFVAVNKGVGGGLIPVRAVMKFEGNTEQGLLAIFSAVQEALPGAGLLPATRTPYIDTALNGDDATRRPALELSQGEDGHRLEIPDGRRSDRVKLIYETTFLPVMLLDEDTAGAFPTQQQEFLTAKDAKGVSAFVRRLLQQALAKRNIPIQDSQERSHALDPGKLGEVAVDLSSVTAIRTRQGDLLAWVPVLIRRGADAAHIALNKQITPIAEEFRQRANAQSFPLPEDVSITNHQDAFAALGAYNAVLFDQLQEGSLSRVGFLKMIVAHLDPKIILDPSAGSIGVNRKLGVFTSAQDNDAKSTAPGFGVNLERFRNSLYAVQETCARLYQLVVPNYDAAGQVGIAVNDTELQNAVIMFYARIQRHLLDLAIRYFNDARVFESLRAEVGDYAQRLNKALREDDALELSRASAEDVIRHLTAKKVDLSLLEEANIRDFIQHSGGLFDLLQLAALLDLETFARSFRQFKLDYPREVLPSDKPLVAIDGSGRIGRPIFAFLLAADINSQTGHIGRYMVASQRLDGQSEQEKLNGAVRKIAQMLSDRQIRDSGTSLRIGQEQALLTDLVESGRISFKAGEKVLAAQLDFQDTDQIPSVYPVHISLDGQLVGMAYCVDIAQFKSGMESALKQRQRHLDNIPRPFIVRGENNQELFFGLRLDATPGGVEIGDQELKRAGVKAQVKLSGDILWELVCKFNLSNPQGSKLGPTEELARIEQIYAQIGATRMPPEGGQQLIYTKAQIAKTPMPGFNSLGGHIGWAIPYMLAADANTAYLAYGSCSTNAGSRIAVALSALGGSPDTVGPTIHMNTSTDEVVTKNPYGHTALKDTGAAKGVSLLVALGEGGQTFFISMRSPFGLVNGKADIVGGSMFDLLVRLPGNIPDELVRRYLARIAAEFPQNLKFFTSTEMKEGKYTWQDTIAGQQTGAILYEGFIERVGPAVYRVKVGYDNEISYSSRLFAFLNAAFLDTLRNHQTTELADIFSKALANTSSSSLTAQEYTSSASASIAEAAPEKTGGIDFRAMHMAIQPMGSFSGLNFSLPQLTKAELERTNLDAEMQQIENMVEAGIVPSGQRIKEFIAACMQKGEINYRVDNLLLCLIDICKLQEENVTESSPELREALAIVDSIS